MNLQQATALHQLTALRASKRANLAAASVRSGYRMGLMGTEGRGAQAQNAEWLHGRTVQGG